ncbi:MAG: hypothetical protein JW965_04015 [Bacteroidales bacterium]|nr:hypothetical protein [Bacteroidales bacterium]
MLFNESHRYILENGQKVAERHQIMGGIYGKMYQESYDYTDTGFVNHIITLGYVTSQRTQGDNNVLRPEAVRSVGLRWYKNRKVINYDMDGKALLVKRSRQEIPVLKEERRAILTMSYAVTGRMLLTESFSRFNKEVLYDLSRIYPFHSTDLSPRPVDAFINEIPGIYDFIISPSWHQLVLYNEDNQNIKKIDIPLSECNMKGGLAVNANDSYYVYDFWNNKYIGLIDGHDNLSQELRKGEARVLAVHRKLNHPQFISTNRHIMQGYVDLAEKPSWNNEKMVLTGVSSLIADETYSLIIALNGYKVKNIHSDDCKVYIVGHEDDNLVRLCLESEISKDAGWVIEFDNLNLNFNLTE